jgi:hypothetical protein
MPSSGLKRLSANGYRGSDRVKLATLWALIQSGSADERLDERLKQVRTVSEGDKGPWVDIVPPKMLSALASIAVMEDHEQDSLAEKWGRTDEFEGWNHSEADKLLHAIADFAASAKLEGKTLLLWTGL